MRLKAAWRTWLEDAFGYGVRKLKPRGKERTREGEGAGTVSSLGPHSEIQIQQAQSHYCHPTHLHLFQPLFLAVSSLLRRLHLGNWTACLALLVLAVGLEKGEEACGGDSTPPQPQQGKESSSLDSSFPKIKS